MTSDLLLCVRHVRNCLVIGIFLAITALALPQISRSGATGAARQESFSFRTQQSVYIVAVRGNIGDPSLSTLDLASKRKSGMVLRNVASSRLRLHFRKRTLFSFA